LRFYIAAPYTQGDPVENTHAVIKAADALLLKGHVPYIPHLNLLWHIVSPKPVEFWYDYDLEWLRCCDCVLRIGGESPGADKEVEEAVRLGLPVYFNMNIIPDAGEHIG